MATQNGSSPDVNGSTSETTESADRIHLGGVFLRSRFKKIYEVCAILDMRPGDFLAMAVENVLREHGWTQDAAEDAAIEAQLKSERKAYAKELAAKKAAKAA
jgi:hypothetical protein